MYILVIDNLATTHNLHPVKYFNAVTVLQLAEPGAAGAINADQGAVCYAALASLGLGV